MKRVVSLSVHKNNKAQRHRKDRRKSIVSSAKSLAHSDCVEGYFMISWDKSGAYRTKFSDPDAIVGKSGITNYIHGCAQRMVSDYDAKDR